MTLPNSVRLGVGSSAQAPARRFERKAMIVAASVSALSAGWLCGSAASAQTAAPDTGTAIQEVVVTAQRRSETAQKVPIPISVVSAADAASKGITEASQLTGMVPSLNISTEGPEMISLRGISTTGTSINQE